MSFVIPTTNPWSCLPASFSMACGIPFAVFIDMLGHDGGDLPYTNKLFKAGFHPQECIEVVQRLSWSCTPIELFPQITPDNIEQRNILFNGDESGNWARFLLHLNNCKNGVIEGTTNKQGIIIGHAVAWDGCHVYDPKGVIYSFSEHQNLNFYPKVLWKLKK